MMFLLYNEEVGAEKRRIVDTDLTELEIILASLKFTVLLEKNKINVISKNQKLMYLMLSYFGKDSEFLDKEVKTLIVMKLKMMRGISFSPRFNFKLNKEKSFESLYKMFLNIFKSLSYNDDLFSVFVMIPLTQKYDVKWRKLIWSEYVDCVRCISCKETQLLENYKEYLYPVETDDSLLKSYASAIANNQVKVDSIPYKIAMHHLQEAQKNAKSN